jgi:hypothetical protein
MALFQIRLLGSKFSDSKPYLAVSLFFPFLSPHFFGSLLRLIAQCTRTKSRLRRQRNTKIDHSSRKFQFFPNFSLGMFLVPRYTHPLCLLLLSFLPFFIDHCELCFSSNSCVGVGCVRNVFAPMTGRKGGTGKDEMELRFD